MKLSAIASRGSRKDFVDLYWLIRQYRSTQDYLLLYTRKFDHHDIGHVIKSLVYFADAEKEPEIRLIKALAWDELKANFEKWVPADKKFHPDWVKSLWERGTRSVYPWPESRLIGMPIGGIGTGSVWLDGQGRLRIWQIFNNLSEPRIPDSFFAVRARAAGGQPVTRVLQTEKEGYFRSDRDDFRGWHVHTLNDIIFSNQAPLSEARQIEHRDVQSVRIAVQYDLSHQEPRNWAMHEAMTRESSTDEKTLNLACGQRSDGHQA